MVKPDYDIFSPSSWMAATKRYKGAAASQVKVAKCEAMAEGLPSSAKTLLRVRNLIGEAGRKASVCATPLSAHSGIVF
jgi:hypothetical protein